MLTESGTTVQPPKQVMKQSTNPLQGQGNTAGQPVRPRCSDVAVVEDESSSEEDDKSNSAKPYVQSDEQEEQGEDMEESAEAEEMDVDKESDEGEKVCQPKLEFNT